MNGIFDQYRIVVSIRVASGFIETGNFFIGNDEDAAINLFSQLKGEPIRNPLFMLRLDLLRHEEGIDTVLRTLDCSLNEMTENIKTITKETFRILNLE